MCGSSAPPPPKPPTMSAAPTMIDAPTMGAAPTVAAPTMVGAPTISSSPTQAGPTSASSTVAAQTGSNVLTATATTAMQNVNQQGADGSTLEYAQTGTETFTDPYTGQTYQIPTYTATQSLSAGQQEVYDTNEGTQQNLATMGNNLSADMMDTYSEMWGADTSEIEKYLFDLGAQTLDPKFADQRTDLATQLSNQGIKLGTAAYDRAMSEMSGDHNKAYNELALYGNSQAFQQLHDIRNQSIGEVMAFRDGSAVTMPDYDINRPSEIANTDVAGIISDQYNQQLQHWAQETDIWGSKNDYAMDIWGQQNDYQLDAWGQETGYNMDIWGYQNDYQKDIWAQENANKLGIWGKQNDFKLGVYAGETSGYQTQVAADDSGGIWGAIGTAAGAGISLLSDRRLKKNISLVARGEFDTFEYNYIWEGDDAPKWRGYMAQDVIKKMPQAVVMIGKWLALDYSQLPEVA